MQSSAVAVARDSRCGDFRAWAGKRKGQSFRGPVPGNRVRAIAAERQTVASGNVRSEVSWVKVVGCGVGVWASQQNVDERRGGVIWEQFLIDTCCDMWGFGV
jgi:hypothetical protein